MVKIGRKWICTVTWQDTNKLNWLGLRHIHTTEKYRPVKEWEPCKFARGNYAFRNRYGPAVFGELGSQRTIAIQQNVYFQRNLLNLVLGPLFVWPVVDYYACKQLIFLQGPFLNFSIVYIFPETITNNEDSKIGEWMNESIITWVSWRVSEL